MFSATFLSVALFVPFAAAAIHDITVGGPDGKLEFSPEAIAAQPGDQVVFHFRPKNHTVTQSSFADPCGLKDGGFDSGFMPVAANVTDNFPTWTLTVNDTTPTWVYCRQAAKTPASHCGQGMVFAINCGADGAPNSFTNFKNSALAVGASLSAAAPSATGYPGYGSPPAATTTTDPAAATGTPSGTTAPATTHTVTVGGPGKLVYSPSQLTANPGDTVTFVFQQKNHTVTQSSFASPCEKLESTSTSGQVGFNSGYMPVPDNSTNFPSWSILINDTAPIWAYCAQKTPVSHCGSGMVLAINSVDNSPKNYSAFRALAMSQNASTTGANPATTSTGAAGANNGAAPRMGAGVGVALAAVGAVFTLLL